MKTLTGGWKIMNMAKLGTVLDTGADPREVNKARIINKMGLSPYTLCEVRKAGTRNGSRNGFAFYIPRIIGGSPAKLGGQQKVAVLVFNCIS